MRVPGSAVGFVLAMPRRGLPLLLLLSTAAPVPGAADEAAVRATARADKGEVTVGEAFTVQVEMTGPAGTVFTFPPAAQTETAELASLAGRTPGPDAQGASGVPAGAPRPNPWPSNQHRYEARTFALGEAKLPELRVLYRLPDGTEGEAVAEGPTVKVGSLLPKGEEESPIADIRPPVSVAIAPVFWMALAALLLVVGAPGYLLWRRLRRPAPDAAAAPLAEVPADVEARQALDRLTRADHFARGDGRGYYIALSAIAKRYLERRLDAPVVEMTTAEMLAFLRESSDREPLTPTMRDVAKAADQVKFAKGEALREEGERHLQAVRQLVARLEAQLQPRAEPGKEPAATDGKAA